MRKILAVWYVIVLAGICGYAKAETDVVRRTVSDNNDLKNGALFKFEEFDENRSTGHTNINDSEEGEEFSRMSDSLKKVVCHFDTLSANQILEELNSRYFPSDEMFRDFEDIEDAFFPLYKNSAIDSCKIRYFLPGEPGYITDAFFSKKGSIIRMNEYYSEDDEDYLRNVIALIPRFYTKALFDNLDRVYISKTADDPKSSKEMRDGDWSAQFRITIYTGNDIISTNIYCDPIRFVRGGRYDYPYEITNVINLVDQLVYEYLRKIWIDYSILEDSDFKVVKTMK